MLGLTGDVLNTEILLLGTGQRVEMLPPALRQHLVKVGVQVDVMSTVGCLFRRLEACSEAEQHGSAMLARHTTFLLKKDDVLPPLCCLLSLADGKVHRRHDLHVRPLIHFLEPFSDILGYITIQYTTDRSSYTLGMRGVWCQPCEPTRECPSYNHSSALRFPFCVEVSSYSSGNIGGMDTLTGSSSPACRASNRIAPVCQCKCR